MSFSPVTAVGSPPVTSISCPDDGEKVRADDLRSAVAALLANDGDLYTLVAALQATLDAFSTTQTTLTPTSFGGGALETFTLAAFTPSLYAVIDIPSVTAGNTVDVSLTLDVQSSVANQSLKLVSIQDYGGASVTTNIDGARYNTTSNTDRFQLTLQGIAVVTNSGPMRVRLEVLAGGTVDNWGTGSLIARVTP